MTKSIIREKEGKYTISEIVNRIQKIGYTQGLNNAFTTFLEMMAVGLAIDMDPTKKQEREARVVELEKGLSKEILQDYGVCFARRVPWLHDYFLGLHFLPQESER